MTWHCHAGGQSLPVFFISRTNILTQAGRGCVADRRLGDSELEYRDHLGRRGAARAGLGLGSLPAGDTRGRGRRNVGPRPLAGDIFVLF